LSKSWKCKRGHGAFFLSLRDGKDFCEYILGYRMEGDSDTKVLYCGDLPIEKPFPGEFQKIAK